MGSCISEKQLQYLSYSGYWIPHPVNLPRLMWMPAAKQLLMNSWMTSHGWFYTLCLVLPSLRWEKEGSSRAQLRLLVLYSSTCAMLEFTALPQYTGWVFLFCLSFLFWWWWWWWWWLVGWVWFWGVFFELSLMIITGLCKKKSLTAEMTKVIPLLKNLAVTTSLGSPALQW